MSSWNNRYISFYGKKNKEDMKMLKQLFECCGIEVKDGNSDENSDGKKWFGTDWDGKMKIKPLMLFWLANKISKGTSIHVSVERGNTVCDYSYSKRVTYKFNEHKPNRIFYYNEETDYSDSRIRDKTEWAILKDLIEKKAKEDGVEIHWEQGDSEDDLRPDCDYDDFYEICEDVRDENEFKLKEYAGKSWDEPIFDYEIDDESLKELIIEAENRSYRELADKIRQVYEDKSWRYYGY